MAKHITQSQVLSRGWTTALIKTFLGEPDNTAPNPYHAHASPMQLYTQSRVESAERTEAFQLAIAKVVERRQNAAKLGENKLSTPK